MIYHHRIRTSALLLATSLAAGIFACGDDPASSDDGDETFNGTIRVLDNRFSPSSVTISVGDSVTWRWDANSLHSVEEGTSLNNPTPLFNSGAPKRSGTFGYRFMTAGTVPYFCRPHFANNMKGTVRVETP
jgi:plastocyanin